MLLANTWETDSRVIREANALAQAGYDVHVICNQRAADYHEVKSAGVTYHCLAANSNQPVHAILRQYLGQLSTLLQVVLAAIADPQTRSQALRRMVLMTIRWLTFIPLAPFLAPALPAAMRSSDLETRAPLLVRMAKRLTRDWLQISSISYLNQFATRASPLAKQLNPAIVHAHDLVTLSAGYVITKSTRAHLVYDAHELETHTNYWGLTKAMRSWIAFYEEVLCRKADAVVTVCESIADWLCNNYGIARPVVVHNSPDFSSLSVCATPGPMLRATLGLASDVPLAVYVGSVTIDRGIEQCVEALAYAPELHLALVGPRYSETEERILALAQQLHLKSRVHLIDPVPSAEVTQFISDADCSVMAIQNVCLSYYFCFPNKLLESVLAGIPVVAARLVELERFVDRFHVGLIADETSPQALGLAIQAAIRQKADFKPDLTTRDEIIRLYGWPTQRARLLELYAGLTGQGVELNS